MSDIIDQAEATEAMERALRIQAVQSRAALQARDSSAEAADCCDCDLPIGEARRRALPGVKTCLDCAAVREHRRRRYR